VSGRKKGRGLLGEASTLEEEGKKMHSETSKGAWCSARKGVQMTGFHRGRESRRSSWKRHPQ